MSIKDKFKKKKKKEENTVETTEIVIEDHEGFGFFIIEKALNVKGVKVNRAEFLSKTLGDKLSPEQLHDAIKNGTAAANVPLEIIRKEAKKCIKHTKKISTGESAITGLPGGVVGITAGILADLTQFYANLIILIQKLVYLYGMKDLRSYDDIRKNNKNLASFILIFIGAATGIQGLDNVVKIITKGMTAQYTKQASKLILFAKPAFYSIAKKIAKSIGVSISKKSFAKAASKAVPFIGAGISAGLNYITFSPMANRLNNILEENYNKPLDEDLMLKIEEKVKDGNFTLESLADLTDEQPMD